MKTIFALALLALVAVSAVAQSPPKCDDPHHADFDFWAGTWNVTDPSGKTVGKNVITKVYDGCALLEKWTSAAGKFAGSSYNAYDRGRDVWHQTWIDNTGNLLLLEGGLSDGAMVLEGTTAKGDEAVRNRITWTPQENGDVRQVWTVSNDGGATWTTAFDGLYSRAD